MSWNAYLVADIDGHEHEVGDWNYTHNCNGMIAKVLTTVGVEMGPTAFWDRGESTTWWGTLDGLSAPDGSKLLEVIIGGLSEAPELFRSMNPENGWGDYDSLLRVLAEMRARSDEYPSAAWRTNG